MSKEIKDSKICLSTISLWPWSTLIASTELTHSIARMYEFNGLEIHPGLTVVREFEKKGFLNVPNEAINSVHESFKTDQRIQKEKGWKTEANASLPAIIKAFIIWNSFPSESRSYSTTKGIEKYLGIPVVIHWVDETEKFDKPLLEVHQDIRMSPEEIRNWAEFSSKRGLVIDLSHRKFWSYLLSQNINPSEWKNILSSFMPYVREVHFQIGSREEVNQVLRGITGGQLGQTLRYIKESKPEIPIVVEATSLASSSSAYLGYKPIFYRKIIDFIRKA